MANRISNLVRAVIAWTGVITDQTRRVLDSTVLDDATKRQHTITMIAAQIRRIRKHVPRPSSVWVREHNREVGRPPCDWDDSADTDRLVIESVDDANGLVWVAEEFDLVDQQAADAVALRALVAGQDVESVTGPVSGASPTAPPVVGWCPPSNPSRVTPVQ